ncbi:MAG: phytanoyl-CoA dioxygenase family protein [Acidimicrobiales bacterium]|nr:phytanoyl-CoA dioxygenase family protein [Acidimicrobiales bacterium]
MTPSTMMLTTGRSHLAVTAAERLAFARDGFVVLDRPIVPLADLARAADLLDGLFVRLDELPAGHVHDLGRPEAGGPGRAIPEVVDPIGLAPALEHTGVVQRCRQVAAGLLGGSARLSFSHAIYKPPHTATATGWHQDLAFNPEYCETGRIPPAVHVWLPLQDATERNGCMLFVPGSHAGPLVEHHRRGHDPRADALVTDEVDPATAVAAPVHAGGLTVHHPATLHASGPNVTDLVRRAWILHFEPGGLVGLRRRWQSRRRRRRLAAG